MAQPYVGEIRMFAGTFAPAGWEFCEGQLLPIAENEPLFMLIGTTYGGDGDSTFALPDLRGRVPLHQGFFRETRRELAETGGVETVTLTVSQIPAHGHTLIGSTDNGSQPGPGNNILASSTVIQPYAAATPNAAMAPNAISPAGANQPHENLQPYLCVHFIISLYGILPSAY